MTALSHSPFLYALGWAIANSLWQMALLWLVYQLFFGISKKNKPITRHLAATVFLFIGFTWFTVTFVTRFIELNSVGKYLVSLPATEAAGVNLQEHFIQNALNWETIVLWIERYLPYLSASYLVILVLLSIRLLNAFAYSQRLKSDELFSINFHWEKFVEEIVQRLGITREVKIYLSGLIDVPATMGFIKPVILLPIATFNHLSVTQVEAVILHEVAHIRRHDYLVNLLVAAVETILFFNPFTLLLSRSLKKEREMCCDDFVVRFQQDPQNYAAALLSLEKMRLGNSGRLAMAATGNKDQLLSRVKRILDVKSSNFNYGQKLIALIVVAGFISSIAWLSPMPASKQSKSKEQRLAWSVNQLLKDTLAQNNFFVVKQRNKKDSIINLAKNRKKVQYQADNMYLKSGLSGDTVVFDGDINWDLFSERIPQTLEDRAQLISPSIMPENSEAHHSPETYFQAKPGAQSFADTYATPNLKISPDNFVLSTNEDFQMAFKQAEVNKIQMELEQLEKALHSETWRKLEEQAKLAGQADAFEKLQQEAREQLVQAWKEAEQKRTKKELNEKSQDQDYFYRSKNYSAFWPGNITHSRGDSMLRSILSKMPVAIQKRKTNARRADRTWQYAAEVTAPKNVTVIGSKNVKPAPQEKEKGLEAEAEESMKFAFDNLNGFGSASNAMANSAFTITQKFPVFKLAPPSKQKKVTTKCKSKSITVIRIITEKATVDIELNGDEDDNGNDKSN